MLAFDTLSAAHDLESAGMERRQAEAVAHAVASLGAAGRDDLATKADLSALEARMTWRLVVAAGVIVAAHPRPVAVPFDRLGAGLRYAAQALRRAASG